MRAFTHDAAGNVTADDRAGTTYHHRYNNRGRLDRLTIGATVTADYMACQVAHVCRRTMRVTPKAAG